MSQVEPTYFFGVEFVPGSFTNITTKVERGSWGSTIVDMFHAPTVGHGLFELQNDDGTLLPRNNANVAPGKAVRLRASYSAALDFTVVNSQRGETDTSSYFNHLTEAALEAWVKPTSLGNGGNAGVLDSMLNDVTSSGRSLFLEGSQMKWRIAVNAGSLYSITDPTTPALGAALHYLGTAFVGSYSALYRGGTLVASTAVAAGSLGMAANHKVRLGTLANDSPSYRWQGILDDALSWVRGVPPAEVAKHAVGSFDDLAGLVGRWKMNEGRGPEVADASGLGHTLRLRGATVLPEWVAGISPYDVTSSSLFSGRISEISGSSRLGKRTVLFDCLDDWDRVARLEYNTRLFYDTNVRSLFTELMSLSSVKSFSVDVIVDKADFAWYSNRDAPGALFDLTKRGNYRLLVDGDGTYYLRDRYWGLFVSNVGTYTEVDEIRSRFSQDTVVNRVKLFAAARQLSSNVTTVSFISAPLLVPGSGSLGFTLTYRDPNEFSEEVPVASIVAQVASQDYYGSTTSDGLGTDLTATLSVQLTSFAATAIASVYNAGATDIWLTRFQVRGFPAVRIPTVGVQRDVSSSQDAFGVKEFSVEDSLTQNLPFLESFSQQLANEHHEGINELGLTLSNEFSGILRNNNGDIFSVIDAFGGNTAEWQIRGSNHELSFDSGLRHTATYDAELRTGQNPYLVLDHATFGKLDDGRVLAV